MPLPEDDRRFRYHPRTHPWPDGLETMKRLEGQVTDLRRQGLEQEDMDGVSQDRDDPTP